jgi:hypothetical protein
VGREVLEGVVADEVGKDAEAIVDNLLGGGLQQDQQGLVDLGLHDHPAELLHAGEVGDHSQTLAADLLVVDLHHVVDEAVDQLHLHHLVLGVSHEEFLVVVEHVGEAAEDGGDEFLSGGRSTAQRSSPLFRSRMAFSFLTSSR